MCKPSFAVTVQFRSYSPRAAMEDGQARGATVAWDTFIHGAHEARPALHTPTGQLAERAGPPTCSCQKSLLT